jgi:hypothetical protein
MADVQEPVPDSKRPVIINWQLYHEVRKFLHKYKDIPHVVVVSNVVEAEILQRDLEVDGRQSVIVSISAVYHSADWHAQMEWANQHKAILIFKSISLASNGWRANFQMGMSCTYYVDGQHAEQLRGRVLSQHGALNRSPVLIARPPQYEIV